MPSPIPHTHLQLKKHALLCLRSVGGAPLGASMGNPRSGFACAAWACTNSLLDLVHALGAWLGRWVDLPVLRGLLPEVGASPSGIGWRMRRGMWGRGEASPYVHSSFRVAVVTANPLHTHRRFRYRYRYRRFRYRCRSKNLSILPSYWWWDGVILQHFRKA